MKDPYHLCCILGCSNIGEVHHEPLRSQLSASEYDYPEYNRYLCRKHHEERHLKGYALFKEDYPEYDGMSIETYRQKAKGQSK